MGNNYLSSMFFSLVIILDEDKVRKIVCLLGSEARRKIIRFLMDKGVKLSWIIRESGVPRSTVAKFLSGISSNIRDEAMVKVFKTIYTNYRELTVEAIRAVCDEILSLITETD